MFDFHPSVTKGLIGRVGLRWRVAFGSAPAAHSPLLPLGCSNQVRSLLLPVDASLAICGSNVVKHVASIDSWSSHHSRADRIRMTTQLLREILDSLRNDMETLGMEEVMTEDEEVPDPARRVGALE